MFVVALEDSSDYWPFTKNLNGLFLLSTLVGLGQLHFQGGRGVELNPTKAFHYFKQASESGAYLKFLNCKFENSARISFYVIFRKHQCDGIFRKGLFPVCLQMLLGML